MGHVGGKARHRHDGEAKARRPVGEDPLEHLEQVEQGEAGALVSGQNGVQSQPVGHRKEGHARQRQHRLRVVILDDAVDHGDQHEQDEDEFQGALLTRLSRSAI